ncbi:MBL fold metallo-hydrolase, partial [Pseudomonas endophytica]|uniref:MBL fold metallo-hydrolase n=1 Tax=Pseudomonas endophytica TaxID=1563157 RepID=UPI000A61EFA6
MHAEIQGFFDPNTSTISYVVHEANGLECAIIDPVLDYNAAAGRVSTDSADRIIRFVDAHGLKVQWLLETHAHADHPSATAYLQQTL